jgi:hypothetical protein
MTVGPALADRPVFWGRGQRDSDEVGYWVCRRPFTQRWTVQPVPVVKRHPVDVVVT